MQPDATDVGAPARRRLLPRRRSPRAPSSTWRRSSTRCRRVRSSGGKRCRCSGSRTSSPGRFAEAVPLARGHARVGRRQRGARLRARQAYVQTRQADARAQAFARTFGVAGGLRRRAPARGADDDPARVGGAGRSRAEARASSKDPRLPQAHALLGQIALFRGRLDEAVGLTEREIAINPGNAMAFYQLGDARVAAVASWDEAIAALQKSIWLNPFYSAPVHPARQGLHEEGAARHRRRDAHAAPSSTTPTIDRRTTFSAQLLQQHGPRGGREAGVRDRRSGSQAPGEAVKRGRLRGACAGRASRCARRGAARPAARTRGRCVHRRGGAAGLSHPVSLRRSRPQALHHRDQRLRRGADRLRQRRLARCARALGTRLDEGARETRLPAGARRPTNRLYRNLHDGPFADVTDAAGLRRTAGPPACAPATSTTTAGPTCSSPPTAATSCIATAADDSRT